MNAHYDTKTVRVHEPDQGRYVYLLLTRFHGEEHLLGDVGYGGEYTMFTTVTKAKDARLADTDPFSLARRHPAPWFRDSNTMDLMYGIQQGPVTWTDIEDGEKYSAEDVAALVEATEVDAA